VPADTLHGSPQLLPLADNGGPTRTHALAAGSPALDAGSNLLQLVTDQRGNGFPRVLGAAADIGAYEGTRALPALRAVPVLSRVSPALLAILLAGIGWRAARRRI
jgi:hypothetical protein